LETLIKEHTTNAILRLGSEQQRTQYQSFLAANLRHLNTARQVLKDGAPTRLTFKQVITIVNGEWSKILAGEQERKQNGLTASAFEPKGGGFGARQDTESAYPREQGARSRREKRRDDRKDDRQQGGRARSGEEPPYRDDTTQGGMEEATVRRDDQASHFRVKKERQLKGQAMSAADLLHFVNAIEPRVSGNCNGCRGQCPAMNCVAAPQTGNHPDYNPFGSRRDHTFVSWGHTVGRTTWSTSL
jgi:hypothetical protein